MQSVVRVDPCQVQEWVASLLHDQDEGKTEKIAYSPGADEGRRGRRQPTSTGWPPRCCRCAEHQRASRSGGIVGNNDKDHVIRSQVQAAEADDLGADHRQGALCAGCPSSPTARFPAGPSGCVLSSGARDQVSAWKARCPTSATIETSYRQAGDGTAPPPSTIITAGLTTPGVRQLMSDLTCAAVLDPAEGRPDGSADHLLRRCDGGAHRAVDGDAGGLGGQDRQPVTRRTRRRAGHSGGGAVARRTGRPRRSCWAYSSISAEVVLSGAGAAGHEHQARRISSGRTCRSDWTRLLTRRSPAARSPFCRWTRRPARSRSAHRRNRVRDRGAGAQRPVHYRPRPGPALAADPPMRYWPLLPIRRGVRTDRRRPGDVVSCRGPPPTRSWQPVGGIRRGRVAGSGDQARPGSLGASPGDGGR